MCIAGALGHANPKVRQQTLEWLQICTSSEPKEGLKPIQAQIVNSVAKLADDPTPAIREAALSVLLELCLKVIPLRICCLRTVGQFCPSS